MVLTRPARHRAPTVVAVAVIVAATTALCGCSSSGGPAGPSHHQSASGSGSSAAPAAGGGTSSAHSSGAASTARGGGSAAGTNFCQRAALEQAAQAKSARQLSSASPASLQRFEKHALDELSGFVAIAPSAIKGDLSVLVAADQKLYNALAAAHFDIRQVDESQLAALRTPAFTKSVASISAYLTKSCGIKTTATP